MSFTNVPPPSYPNLGQCTATPAVPLRKRLGFRYKWLEHSSNISVRPKALWYNKKERLSIVKERTCPQS